MNSRFWNAKTSGPLHDGQCLSVVGEEVVDGAVVHLNKACRPSAVFRAVVPIIIDAVKRMIIRWSRPHVVVERLKTLAPPVTYRYTPGAVPRPHLAALLVAPLQHGMVDKILGGFPDKPRVTVLDATVGIPTPAGFCLTDFQVMRVNHGGFSALALAKELHLFGFIRGNPVEDKKPAKGLARKIVEFTPSHIFTSIMVSNHWRMPGNKVIDVLLSAAKPIRAVGLYQP